MRKKVWSTPELVILVKGSPEENVLDSCKSIHGALSSSSATPSGQNCKAIHGQCGACSNLGGGAS